MVIVTVCENEFDTELESERETEADNELETEVDTVAETLAVTLGDPETLGEGLTVWLREGETVTGADCP